MGEVRIPTEAVMQSPRRTRCAKRWRYSRSRSGGDIPWWSWCSSACPGRWDTSTRCGGCAGTPRSLSHPWWLPGGGQGGHRRTRTDTGTRGKGTLRHGRWGDKTLGWGGLIWVCCWGGDRMRPCVCPPPPPQPHSSGVWGDVMLTPHPGDTPPAPRI